jgi:hypothetical protein
MEFKIREVAELKLYQGLNPDPRAWVYGAMSDIVSSGDTGFPHLDNVIHLLYDDLELLPCDRGSVRKYQGLDYLTEPELELLSTLDRPFSAIIDRLAWDADYSDYSAQPEWPSVTLAAARVMQEMEAVGIPQVGIDYALSATGKLAQPEAPEDSH